MSKAEKMRGRLASIQKDREEFERQRKELEADMNVGRNNMNKINKGLRNNAILEEPIVIESHKSVGAHAGGHHNHSSKPSSDRNHHIRSGSITDPQVNGNPSPTVGGSASTISNAAYTPNGAAVGAGNHFFVNGSGANNCTATVTSMLNIMPSGPRVSDWCYSAPIDSPAPPLVKSREMYENVRLLGRGSFGEVNLVKNVEDNKL